MEKNTCKLRNGSFTSEGGMKEIAFKKVSNKPMVFEIEPVLYGIFRGDYSIQTTYQKIEKDDFILGFTWYNGRESIVKTFYTKYNGDRMTIFSEEESMIIWDTIKQSYPWIEEFFRPVTLRHYHTRLPIPEEEWLSFINRRKLLDGFEEKFGYILDHLDSYNKKEDLRFKPRKLDFNLNEYIPSFTHESREYKSTYKEIWYLSKGKGYREPDNTIRISPRFDSTSDYKMFLNRSNPNKSLSEYISEEFVKHQGYKYLIKYHNGVHYNERKGIYYGQSVDVWYL